MNTQKEVLDCFGSLEYRRVHPEEAHVYVWIMKDIQLSTRTDLEKLVDLMKRLVIDHEVDFEKCSSCHYKFQCRRGVLYE